MTIEEKAKAYDEVLERVKPLYEWAKKDDSPMWSTYEYLFPQLAESEDERTRREIIDFIQWAEDRGMTRHDYHQAKRPAVWIAYLEKQKDANKAIEAVERIDKYIDEHLANAHDMKDSDSDKKYYRGLDDALGKMAGILQDVYSGEKKKESLRDFIDDFPYSDEQKEPHFTKRNALFDKCVENCDPEVMKKVSDEIDKMLQKEQKPIDYEAELKKCKDNPLYFFDKYVKVKLKPAEWSENDKLHYVSVLNALEYVKGCKSDYDKIEAVKSDIAWLRELPERFNLPPKQEWSEEDEDTLNSCISSIEEAKENRYAYKETDGDTSYDYEIKWLKSLRPSWKPSEEQMRAFKGYIEDFQARAEAAVGGWNNFDVMIRLYEQLKHLRD